MEKFVSLYKEFQALTTKTASTSGVTVSGLGQGAVLDANIAA